jgi:hypothetical protein
MSRFRLIAGIAVAAISCCAPAHADESSFLKVLAQDGIPADAPADVKMDTQIGYVVCDAMYRGESREAVTTELMNAHLHEGYDVDPRMVERFIDAAHSQLCPDAH